MRLMDPTLSVRERLQGVKYLLSNRYFPSPEEWSAFQRKIMQDLYGKKIDYENMVMALYPPFYRGMA